MEEDSAGFRTAGEDAGLKLNAVLVNSPGDAGALVFDSALGGKREEDGG